MGWICWIFLLFFFNAQRKHGGKFNLDRRCDYFSSFVKIGDYITTGRKGRMLLTAPFLFFLPLSPLAFLLPSWDTTRWWDLPYKHGSGLPRGGSGSLWSLRQEGAAQHLAWVTTLWFSSTPAWSRGQVGTHEQCQ